MRKISFSFLSVHIADHFLDACLMFRITCSWPSSRAPATEADSPPPPSSPAHPPLPPARRYTGAGQAGGPLQRTHASAGGAGAGLPFWPGCQVVLYWGPLGRYLGRGLNPWVGGGWGGGRGGLCKTENHGPNRQRCEDGGYETSEKLFTLNSSI